MTSPSGRNNKISFVYFDVGGVVELDFSGTNKWAEMQAGLGVTESTRAQFEAIWDQHRARVCLDYDVERLVPQMRKIGLPLPPNYSMLQDFVDRYDPNPWIWPVIAQAQTKYRTGLLTNMYPGLLRKIYSRPDLRVDHKWDVTVDSSVVGAQKPDPAIFEIAEKVAGVPAAQILFVENQSKHINAAQARGWQTFLYDSAKPDLASRQLSDLLRMTA